MPALFSSANVRLWGAWIVASAVSFAIGGALTPEPGFSPLWLLAPLVYGVGQWLVLRRSLPNASYWLLVTVIGAPVALLIATGVLLLTGFPLTAPPPRPDDPALLVRRLLYVGAFGISLGLFQAIVLRARFSRALWWIVGSVLGLLALALAAGVDGRTIYLPMGAVNGLVAGIAYGVTTGPFLAWIVSGPRRTATPPASVVI